MKRITVEIDVDKFDGEDIEGCYNVLCPDPEQPDADAVVFASHYTGFEELAFEIKANVLKVLRDRVTL